MSSIKNNEISHTGNSGTSNIVLGASGEVTPNRLKIGSDAAGDIAYYNGTQYVRLAPAGASRTLKMNSSNNAPEWVSVADKGGWTLVGSSNTGVGTGTSHTFTGISATARQVLYLFKGISFNGDQNYSIRIGPSGGVVTSGYLNNNIFWGNSSQGTQSTTDCFRWNSTNAAAYTGNGYVHFTYFHDDIWQAFGWFSPSNATGTSSAHYLFNGSVDCGTALERIELYPQSSANLDAGTVTVYEVT